MSVLRNLDPSKEKDYNILRSFGMIAMSSHWKDVREYLEAELNNLDVRNRTAAPYMATRLGAQAEILQKILDKFANSLDVLGSGKVG